MVVAVQPGFLGRLVDVDEYKLERDTLSDALDHFVSGFAQVAVLAGEERDLDHGLCVASRQVALASAVIIESGWPYPKRTEV
ncbi:MAG: hypothetical protein AMXMBFR13_33040 [Phycisphaerae bacterium]